jgi:hypothetical protein
MTAAPQFLAGLDWTAEGHRPAGQPGKVSIGRTTRRFADADFHTGLSYPAVRLASGEVWYWRETTNTGPGWLQAYPALAATFVPGPEWQSRCTHLHAVAWWPCLTAAQCDALAREEER